MYSNTTGATFRQTPHLEGEPCPSVPRAPWRNQHKPPPPSEKILQVLAWTTVMLFASASRPIPNCLEFQKRATPARVRAEAPDSSINCAGGCTGHVSRPAHGERLCGGGGGTGSKGRDGAQNKSAYMGQSNSPLDSAQGPCTMTLRHRPKTFFGASWRAVASSKWPYY